MAATGATGPFENSGPRQVVVGASARMYGFTTRGGGGSLPSIQPLTHGYYAAALRVTAAADRAGGPCGPAGRLAHNPLPAMRHQRAVPLSRSTVDNSRTEPRSPSRPRLRGSANDPRPRGGHPRLHRRRCASSSGTSESGQHRPGGSTASGSQAPSQAPIRTWRADRRGPGPTRRRPRAAVLPTPSRPWSCGDRRRTSCRCCRAAAPGPVG